MTRMMKLTWKYGDDAFVATEKEELVFQLMDIVLGYPDSKAFAASIFACKALPGRVWAHIRNVPKRYQVYRDDIALVVKVEPAYSPDEREGLALNSSPEDTVIYGSHIHPSADEMHFFVGCELLAAQLKSRMEAIILQHALRVGNRVKVTAGSMLGLSGKIEELLEESATIYIGSLDIAETLLLSKMRGIFVPVTRSESLEGGGKEPLDGSLPSRVTEQWFTGKMITPRYSPIHLGFKLLT
ncbi:hypothetical protein CPB84DRAFT_1754732 [Gymnopilus junonius]|uniref:Uncharacterized protein n=1 Tax=Gymnopilus junonius TaxID=109634 RepID=A0A9P5TEK7_GYMJU|nr:hypothetical protein CPB84DRAFT_1754732 [Gymnopilus junonius]